MAGPEPLLLLAGDGPARRLTADGLALHGHRVLLARDGLEALDILQANPGGLGCLIADADLGDGLAVARMARLLDPAIGVILTVRSPRPVPEPGAVKGALLLCPPCGPGEIAEAVAGLRRERDAGPGRRAA